MIIDRVYTPSLAQVAYFIADKSAGEVAIIDPRRDIEAYIDWAASRDLRFTAILETHVHADFVSGALELQAVTGAPIYVSRLGNQDFEHVPLDDRDTIAIGDLRLEARWTPGHTPEHIAFVLTDPRQRPEPLAIFSGDLLFVGDVGRPDLLGSEQTDALATQLFETFASRLKDLPDDVVVYPGHTAGSSCGKRIGEAPTTTMGEERRGNYALQYRDRDAFVAAVMNRMPLPPAYYPRMKIVNKVGPAPLKSDSSGRPLMPGEVEAMLRDGAVLIDARSEDAFDRAHVRGSYYAGDTPEFINWVGWLAPYDRQIILLLNEDDAFSALVTELSRIGLDDVAGYLQGGIDAWIESGRPVARLHTVSPLQLRRRIEGGDDVNLVDVRTEAEWEDRHIPGSTNFFAGRIITGAPLPAGNQGELALTCATGFRSRVAASLLESQGVDNLVQLAGGIEAWEESGYPVRAA